MKLTIEPTGERAELPSGNRGEVWIGSTEDGIPIVTVLVSVGCTPEHQAALARAMHPHDGADAELVDTRRRAARRCSWRDRLLGTPPMPRTKRNGHSAKNNRRPIHR